MLIILSILLIPLIYYAVPRTVEYDQCGRTAEEARARGCVFESTGFTWLPKRCHDAQIEEEFLEFIKKNELNLYRDSNYTDIVSVEELPGGDGPGFFVRQKYHTTNCLFLVQKLHRAFASGKIVDGQIMPTLHTEHCVGQVLQPPGFREHDVPLSYTKFPYCGKLGGYHVDWKNGIEPLGWIDY
ncbi:hypothetical protein DM02DRAFT_656944 [Periconia macrospinosa]|uniref:Uncharacterized protein n=1 Tax=Periconia macrospinosa TaxID=97972 RepID=A0A2V1DLT7_9PLEO|nr:hypothetical protein DM02DRAFT_656944 [Periconia macrospinosa]